MNNVAAPEISMHENVKPAIPRILLAASGSVAAIKFENMCRSFSEWAEVRAVVTKSSLRFIDTTALPKDVILYTDEEEWSSWKKIGDDVLHIELRKWADVLVIAPLSANTLAKIAGGLCDNLLTCIVRAWDFSKQASGRCSCDEHLHVEQSVYETSHRYNPRTWNIPITSHHKETCLWRLRKWCNGRAFCDRHDRADLA